MSQPPSLSDFADQYDRERFAENAEIARSNRTLRATLAERDAELAQVRERLGLLERLSSARIEPPTWLAPAVPSRRHVGIPTLSLGDVHWDEVVLPEQVGGINAYNRTIALGRVQRAYEGAIVVARDYLKGLDYEGFNLLLPGDMISGDIHEELRETNEDTVIGSVLSILEPLEAGIKLLAKEFGQVHVVGVVGNHPRTTKKPRMKMRPQGNFDYLLYKLIERDMVGVPGVTVQVPESADALYSIYHTRYLLTHGDQFHGGSGISGILAPLLLGAHRKTRRQSVAGQPYDVMVMGHFHQTLMFPSKGLIVGGTVKGYDEYAYNLNLEPEPPQCAFWVTTPERGVTFPASVYVEDRKAEGW